MSNILSGTEIHTCVNLFQLQITIMIALKILIALTPNLNCYMIVERSDRVTNQKPIWNSCTRTCCNKILLIQ